MWHRFALTLYLVGAIVAPALGQAAGTAAEQKLRQEIEAVFTSWLDALNRGDGKAAAAFFAPDAPTINPAGVVRGDFAGLCESNRAAASTEVQDDGDDRAGAGDRKRCRLRDRPVYEYVRSRRQPVADARQLAAGVRAPGRHLED
jgi:hypothetical protein